MREFTSTLPEISSYYIGELNNYKTVSSKKAFLTRSLKDVKAHHNDLVDAYHTPHKMLFGERVNRIDIIMAVEEIKIISNIYNTL